MNLISVEANETVFDIPIQEDEELFKELSELEEEELNFEEEEEGLNNELLSSTEPELDDLSEFQIKQDEQIDKLIEERKKSSRLRYTNTQNEALRIQLKDIAKSPKKLSMITKRTKIIRLSDDKVFYINKDIKVMAHTKQDYDRYRYILDKNNNIRYRVDNQFITDITLITQMYKKPHKFKRLKKKIIVDRRDKSFDYQFKFNLHSGLYKAGFSKKLVQHNKELTPMFRLESIVLSNFKFSIQAGLGIMYEFVSGNTQANTGKFSYQSLSVGPTFKTKPLLANFSFILQPRLSLFSQISVADSGSEETRVFKISETAMLLGVEKDIKLRRFGHWVYGFSFQRKWLKANATDTSIDVGNNINYDDSYGVHIGHRSDWIF